jgi:rSAM/selenodomain-associated transferase 2
MRISVVIPTLNEATTIAATLRRLKEQVPDEIVVADASSPDGTAELARSEGVLVVEAPRGRGIQQNRGARKTKGDVLLFLHADCWLEDAAIDELRRFLRDHPSIFGGCFRQRVDASHPLFRAIDLAAHLRAGLLGIPYGDQGIFVRRAAFDAIGGFPETPLMEDVFMSLQLRCLGRVAVLPKRIFVSPRRWHQQGIVRQTLTNWALTAAVAIGVPTRSLAHFYLERR